MKQGMMKGIESRVSGYVMQSYMSRNRLYWNYVWIYRYRAIYSEESAKYSEKMNAHLYETIDEK